MPDHSITGLKILIAEDEYLLADDLSEELRGAGAEVIGPVATVRDAGAIVDGGQALDAAVLDVNLGGEMIYPVADRLTERQVPFAFITGYDSGALPARFADAPRFGKPISAALVRTLIAPLADKP